jgi:hypothetical protein
MKNTFLGFNWTEITKYKLLYTNSIALMLKQIKRQKKEGYSLTTGVLYHGCMTEPVNTFHVSYTTRINGIT